VSPRDTRARLIRRAAKADVPLTAPVADQLTTFLDLLLRWNRKINLTALHDADDAVDRLLLEPLAAVRHLGTGAGRLIDLGSGGGSPAIPLALARRDLQLTMVETKARKAAFLREAVRVLELPGAVVETTRYEDLLAAHDHRGSYAAVTVRALRIETTALRDIAAFLSPDAATLLLFRGPAGPDALPDVGETLRWVGTYPLLETLQSRVSVYRRE
jgi:16S rRNA (guanine527-N7)-methyltransferase